MVSFSCTVSVAYESQFVISVFFSYILFFFFLPTLQSPVILTCYGNINILENFTNLCTHPFIKSSSSVLVAYIKEFLILKKD